MVNGIKEPDSVKETGYICQTLASMKAVLELALMRNDKGLRESIKNLIDTMNKPITNECIEDDKAMSDFNEQVEFKKKDFNYII